MTSVDATSERAWLDVVGSVLGRAQRWSPDRIAETLAAAMARLEISADVYLVDHEQRCLRPLPRPGRPTPHDRQVDSSTAGRAFVSGCSIVAAADDGHRARWWVPLVCGADRLGVLDFVLPAGLNPHTGALQQRCELMAGLIGPLIATAGELGDHLPGLRRSRPMSVASELLRQLLQPPTAAGDEVTVSAILQPCYDVGGDGYDYVIDSQVARFAVLDGAGRGLRAGLATAVALAAVRAARRDGHDLRRQAWTADAALREQFPDVRFVTAVLAELHLGTGRLRYVNAGHPSPLLMRAGKIIGEISDGRRMPLGLDDPGLPLGEHQLQPGDQLLLYTDGITEARDPNREFLGLPRLIELVERQASAGLPAPEMLRRLSRSIDAYRKGSPADDATLLLAEWSPHPPRPDAS